MRALWDECLDLASDNNIDALLVPLTTKATRTYEKSEVPRIAAAALVIAGEDGIRALDAFLRKGDIGGLRATAALRALWNAGRGASPMESSIGITYRPVNLSDSVRRVAKLLVDDFVVDAFRNADRYQLVVNLLHAELLLYTGRTLPPFAADVLRVTQDSSIVLTLRLIEEFEALVEAEFPEAYYQQFLERHPVFLDPLAAHVLNREKLGRDLITDFVIRRHDGLHVVVEIERPQDDIFTKKNDFTARFTHASGQVLDFQGWVAEHAAYAQKTIGAIEAPHGLLIMGRRTDLSEEQSAKLRRWSMNSRNIEVLTFDDLGVRARALHASLRGGAVH